MHRIHIRQSDPISLLDIFRGRVVLCAHWRNLIKLAQMTKAQKESIVGALLCHKDTVKGTELFALMFVFMAKGSNLHLIVA